MKNIFKMLDFTKVFNLTCFCNLPNIIIAKFEGQLKLFFLDGFIFLIFGRIIPNNPTFHYFSQETTPDRFQLLHFLCIQFPCLYRVEQAGPASRNVILVERNIRRSRRIDFNSYQFKYALATCIRDFIRHKMTKVLEISYIFNWFIS